jgi:hypothetical protein
MSWNLGTLTSWNPLGHCRPLTRLLYLFYSSSHLEGLMTMNKESTRKISLYISRNTLCNLKTHSMYGGAPYHNTRYSSFVCLTNIQVFKPKQQKFPHVIFGIFLNLHYNKLSIYQMANIHWDLTFTGLCIVVYSYNESQRDALFLRFIWQSTLHVSDRSNVHHQEYLKTVYTQ